MKEIDEENVKVFWVRGAYDEPVGMIAYRWPIEPVQISDPSCIFEVDTVFIEDDKTTKPADPKDVNAYIVEFAYSVWDKNKDIFNRKTARSVAIGRLKSNLCRRIVIKNNHPVRGIMSYLAAGRFPIIRKNYIWGFEGIKGATINGIKYADKTEKAKLKHSTPPHRIVKAARMSITNYYFLQDMLNQVYLNYVMSHRIGTTEGETSESTT